MTLREASLIFLDHIDLIGIELVNTLVKELEDQGHRASGSLINSVVHEVANKMNEAVIYIRHLRYGKYVNDPLPASKVPYSRGSGAKTSKFIQEIAAWVKRKKITSGLDKDIMDTTFAIVNKMKKEGRPTIGSYKFSKNGRRTGWIDYVVKKFKVKLEPRVQLAYSELVSNSFIAVIERISEKSSNKYITIR